MARRMDSLGSVGAAAMAMIEASTAQTLSRESDALSLFINTPVNLNAILRQCG